MTLLAKIRCSFGCAIPRGEPIALDSVGSELHQRRGVFRRPQVLQCLILSMHMVQKCLPRNPRARKSKCAPPALLRDNWIPGKRKMVSDGRDCWCKLDAPATPCLKNVGLETGALGGVQTTDTLCSYAHMRSFILLHLRCRT